MASINVDAIVIGAGPGGYHAAIRLGQLGKNVVCFDRDEVGGVCLNWGCIPTKALLHVGEITRQIDHAAEIGIKVPKAEIDREGVAGFKDKVVKANVGGVGQLFKANNVTFAYGDASFVAKNKVSLKKKDGTTDEYTAPAIVIATGGAPIDVKAWPHDGETIINSDDAVQLKRIPEEPADRRRRRDRPRIRDRLHALRRESAGRRSAAEHPHRHRSRDLENAGPHPQEARHRDRAFHEGRDDREDRRAKK